MTIQKINARIDFPNCLPLGRAKRTGKDKELLV
jgi:hypothetical protein